MSVQSLVLQPQFVRNARIPRVRMHGISGCQSTPRGFMDLPVPLVILIVLAFGATGAMHAQITNPIAEPIVKRGLNIEIREVARLPDTRGLYPADRVARV